jgi:hypothetical protein
VTVEEDIARLERLGFVWAGVGPLPHEHQFFTCPRTGWSIGIPVDNAGYLLRGPGRPTVGCGFDSAIDVIAKEPSLSEAEQAELRKPKPTNEELRVAIAQRIEELKGESAEIDEKIREMQKPGSAARLKAALRRKRK